ncbi:GNAT family N-acetyltransferase [Candidatus Pacearchaeota archaeon]|nr:GNAT family N-acetyltransferase [Candidatus Pacearchaeota archaeon]
MKLRRANINDVPSVAIFHDRVLSNYFRALHEVPVSIQDYENKMRDSFDASNIYILQKSPKDYKGFVWYELQNGTYRINDICVSEQRKGYGSLLLEQVIDSARKKNLKSVEIILTSGNDVALDFFKRRHFSPRHTVLARDL